MLNSAEPFSIKPYVLPLAILAVVALVTVLAGDNSPKAMSVSSGDAGGLAVNARDAGTFVIEAGARKFELHVPQTVTLNAPAKIVRHSNAALVTLSVSSTAGDSREICAWLVKSENAWHFGGEFFVETFNHKEEGEKNEMQSFAFESDGSLRRSVKRNNVEGIKTTCGDKCECVIWQTRTVVTEEEEIVRWDGGKPVRTAFKKWYVTQTNENLLSISKKLNIGIEKFPALYYLNPGLQKLDSLPEGMKLLVEKFPR